MTNSGSEKVVGYVLTIDSGNGWMFLGTDLTEVSSAFACELEGYQGLSIDEIPSFKIEPREFTLDELKNMPEFPGW